MKDPLSWKKRPVSGCWFLNFCATALIILITHGSCHVEKKAPEFARNVCEPRILLRHHKHDRTKYWQCAPMNKYAYVGEWKLEDCPENHEFVLLNQTCLPKRYVRRQQSLCQGPGAYGGAGSPFCPPSCTATNVNPALGGGCNWQSAGLMPAAAPNAFLQCTPQSLGAPCGNWQQMNCNPGTQFNPQLQVCVSVSLQGNCGATGAAVCPCSQQPAAATANACPAACVCIQATCCQPQPLPGPYPVPVPTVPVPSPTLPRCPSGQTALSYCNVNQDCPQEFICLNGVACCPPPPLPYPLLPLCPTGEPPLSRCSPELGPNGCPVGYACLAGGCCAQPLPICPTGQVASQLCNGIGQGSCPPGFICENQGCCPLPALPICPAGIPASAFCLGDGSSTCLPGYSCTGGMCCPPMMYTTVVPTTMITTTSIPPLPVCPNGKMAQSRCTASSQGAQNTCGSGYLCKNGGCCALGQCASSGQLAVDFCMDSSTCPTGSTCTNGMCCQLPICPTGELAHALCSGASGEQSTCDSGQACIQNGCCSLPVCPSASNSFAQSFCTGTGQSTCSAGFVCINSGCCPIPMCPNGSPGAAMCQSQAQCPLNLMCINGACCQLPPCATGAIASQVCGVGGQCPMSYFCDANQLCCPLPMCPMGHPASQPCPGPGPAGCPVGQFCSNGGCCPLPVCSNGQPTQQVCTPGGPNVCPAGMTCEPTGACCPLPLPQCPPSGQLASQWCDGPGSCPLNFYCFIQGTARGCCPIPRCSTGEQAISPCDVLRPCPPNYRCENGGCCPIPLPVCPATGAPALAFCNGVTGQVCPPGSFCIPAVGACCPLTCPNGVAPLQPCAPGCPPRSQCINGACCPLPLPQCPNGVIAASFCDNNQGCAPGYYCAAGGCCLLPPCPTGDRAVEPCGPAGQCSVPNLQCFNGISCCPIPTAVCPTGVPPVGPCGVQGCPPGSSCLPGIGCCPQTLPVCPNGVPSVQACGPALAVCAPGYQCINGGCCLQGFAPTPLPGPVPPAPGPVCQIQVCICAIINNVCPQYSSCSSGTCCASGPGLNQYGAYGGAVPAYGGAVPAIGGVAPPLFPGGIYNLHSPASAEVRNAFGVPGTPCQNGQDCKGYPMAAACLNNFCSCINGARSDGLQCTTRRLHYSPRNSCSQFGTPCSKTGAIGLRRKPPTMEELGIDNTTKPEFWYPVNVKDLHCQHSEDCVPDMVCVKNKCLPGIKCISGGHQACFVKRPGEYQCETDEQCSSICEDKKQCGLGKCVRALAINGTVCACDEGYLVHSGGCMRICPEGMVLRNKKCLSVKEGKSSLAGKVQVDIH